MRGLFDENVKEPLTKLRKGVMNMQKRVRVSSGSTRELIVGYRRAIRVGNRVEVAGTTAIKDGEIAFGRYAGALIGWLYFIAVSAGGIYVTYVFHLPSTVAFIIAGILLISEATEGRTPRGCGAVRVRHGFTYHAWGAASYQPRRLACSRGSAM